MIFDYSESADQCLLRVVILLSCYLGGKKFQKGENGIFAKKLNKIRFLEDEKLRSVLKVAFWPPRSFEAAFEARLILKCNLKGLRGQIGNWQ